MRKSIYYIVILLSLSSCRKDEFEDGFKSVDKSYTNQSIGSYAIYQVDEVIYDDFTNSIDTNIYQLMEHNESEFKDNLGRNAIRIDRYKRANDTAQWIYLNTWYSVTDEYMSERIENNKRFIKLSFPISIEAVWNANALNMDNASTVFYGMMHQSYRLDTFKFSNAISVESNNFKDVFRERNFKEVYAKGFGLVYKNWVNIERFGQLQRGFRLRYQLKSYVP